jgi:anti-sigma-K factor RskA
VNGLNQEANNLEEWEAQLAEYTLGAMAPEAAAEFERGLNECRAHVVLSTHYTQVMGLLGSAAPSAEPPSGHKDRFMARLASAPQEAAGTSPAPTLVPSLPAAPPPAPGGNGLAGARVTDIGEYRARRRPAMTWPAIAAIAAALVVLVGGAFWINNLNRGAVISDRAVVFAVQGTDAQKSAVAVGVVDPATNQAFLVTNGLQPVPPDQVYELWWLPPEGQGAPVAAGTFEVDATGKAKHIATLPPKPLSSYTGLAVSLEKAPAPVDKPGGPIVLVGTYEIR